MSALSLTGLHRSYGSKVVLDDFDLEVADGEFISLLGPSGCGKTTTLGIIAGFVAPDMGTVRIDSSDVTSAPANKRNTAMVFQNYALFPHLTVASNIGYGLRIRKLPRAEVGTRVEECMALMGIAELAGRYPGQLSGGQQQRVAVARALAVRPGLLLMDEPLSNLDARLRADIRSELRAIQLDLGLTVVFVTHDQEEALTMSDRIVLMNHGRVEQVGPPDEVYGSPRTTFVADFLGVRNIFEGSGNGNRWRARHGVEFACEARTASVGVRPSRVGVLVGDQSPRSSTSTVIVGTVRAVSYLGDTVGYEVETVEGIVRATAPSSTPPADREQEVRLELDPAYLLPLQPSVGGDPIPDEQQSA